MLLSQLIKNVDSLNSLNEKIGCSEFWTYNNDPDSNWFRFYQKKDCRYSFISTFDIECLLGGLDTPFLIGVEFIHGVQRLTLSVSKSLIEI